jgi:hypothetical protein
MLALILDIDGTLIGNIVPQILLYDLKTNRLPIKFSNKDLFDRFDHGLARPYFDTFLKQLRARIHNIEIFIYTAGEDKWGLFIANQIERYYSIKINRPIFTRKYCILKDNTIRKSITKITPYIKRNLERRYGKLKNIKDHILVIDNSRVFDQEDYKHLIVCPTYKYTYIENLPALVNEYTFMRNKSLIEESLIRMFPNMQNYTINTYKDFEKVFYTYYLRYLESKNNDKFWFYLSKLLELKNITNFNPKVVSYINRKLSKRLQ